MNEAGIKVRVQNETLEHWWFLDQPILLTITSTLTLVNVNINMTHYVTISIE